LIEAEPLPSDPPKAPASGKHSTMTGVGPVSLEAGRKEPIPEELRQLATAARAQEAQDLAQSIQSKASDPLAATVRAATSPFAADALGDGDRPIPKPAEVERPAPVDEPIAAPANPRTVSQVPPSATNIEPEPEVQLPESRTPRWLWLSVFGIAAGVLSFLAVPVIRNLIAPSPPPAPPIPRATASAPAPVDTAVIPPPAVETAAAPQTSAAPSAAAPAALESQVPTQAPAPPAGTAAPPATPPASADAPDEAALASLEKGTGFLYVASSLQTNVYVYGIAAGQTNQRLVSKCGPRFIRLGTAPGAWQGPGSVSIVKCGGFTRVQMP
jgi:hypothetical protein